MNDKTAARTVPCRHPKDFGGSEHPYDVVYTSTTPPRPDERWVAGVGRQEAEPKKRPKTLPAPPKVAVMVSEDLVKQVKRYVDGLEANARVTRDLCPKCLSHAVSLPKGHAGGCAVYDRT